MATPLEHHIINAALITTRPTSTPEQRNEASNSLHSWTNSDELSVWDAYCNILKSFTDNGIGGGGSEHSAASTASVESNIIEKIAYATSPSKPHPSSAPGSPPGSGGLGMLETQIRHEATGAKLLLITLLSNKIRSEYGRLRVSNASVARGVYHCLLSTLVSVDSAAGGGAGVSGGGGVGSGGGSDGGDRQLLNALSTAVAAAVVRNDSGVAEMITMCHSSIAASLGMTATVQFSPLVALKLLAEIPSEAATRTDLTSTQLDSFLADATSPSLQVLHLSLGAFLNSTGKESDMLLCLTLQCLSRWMEDNPSASVSKLNQCINGASILSQLVGLLSNLQHRPWSDGHYAQQAIIHSATSLSGSIVNLSDYGTSSRKGAVGYLLGAISSVQFIVGAIKLSTAQSWGEATVALSTLASTLARVDIEDICTCSQPGSLELFELLLELQSGEHAVATPVLEVWLALQDVPTNERHGSLVDPLYKRLVGVLVDRVSYPKEFVSWEEEFEVDPSEFEEMRRLSADVLIGAYELLRSTYLEMITTVITKNESWEMVESALFCLCAVAREACARVKSANNALKGGRESPAAVDGGATATGLTSLASKLCDGGTRQHVLVLKGIATFLGSYSVVWAATCPAGSILEILSYLSGAMGVSVAAEAAGKSVRLVLIASVSKLVKSTSCPGADPSAYGQISSALVQCMNSALATGNAEVMAGVAEGCCRVTIQLGDKSQSRTILSTVAESSIQRAKSALAAMISSSSIEGSGEAASQSDAASQVLASCLGVLRELIRFCDGVSPKEGEPHVLSDVLNSAWPVLNDISSQSCCRSSESVLTGLLEVHSQLLSVVPTLIGPYFKELVQFVVRAYEESFIPSALDYVSAAVESFGSEQSAIASSAGFDDNAKDVMFNQLLAHLSQCTFNYVTQTKRPNECPQVISALFNMAQRFLLFCPAALCQCSEFNSLFLLAVTCLTECKGEIDSTRSSLIYLNQLIGWKHIRLTGSKLAILEQSAGAIDSLLIQHGETIIKACMSGMSGPQILWPSFSECMFSIMLHVAEGTQVMDEHSVLHNWLYAAMNGNGGQNITPEVGMTVAKLLCDFAREGGKSKPRAKMLLMDYGKICKGETGKDALLAYSLA